MSTRVEQVQVSFRFRSRSRSQNSSAWARRAVKVVPTKAISRAQETVRNIHWFQVVETRGHVVDGQIAHWQVTIKAGFTLE